MTEHEKDNIWFRLRNLHMGRCLRKQIFPLGLSFVLMINVCLFAACSPAKDEYEYNIFYLSKDENQLVQEGYDAKEETTAGLIDELIKKLGSTPDSFNATVPGLDVTNIISEEMTDEGYIVLDFDSNYYTMPIIKETLCRAAIVKTLCQIPGVNGVGFNIDGNPHLNSEGEAFGYMNSETFVDNTSGETTYKQTISVNLYFADSTGKKLVKVPTNVTFDGTISMEQLVMQQIISGPESVKGVDKTLKGVIPENTVVNQITVRDQICYIDLGKEFLSAVDGVDRIVTLYSVVNSLVELPDINKVQFTIDGETINFYGNRNIVFDSPLERNLEIIKE